MQIKRITNNGHQFITNGQDFQYFPEGIFINRIKKPVHIKPFLVEKTLFNIALNYLGLNPDIETDEMVSFLWSINGQTIFVEKPLSDTIIRKIVSNVYSKRDKDGIQLKSNQLIYTVYSLDCTLTKEERRAFTNKMIGLKRSEPTKAAIYTAIEEWDSTEKITQKAISTKLGKGFKIRTIKKYWPEFKEMVKDFNLTLTSNKSEVNTYIHEEEINEPETSREELLAKLESIKDSIKLSRFFMTEMGINNGTITQLEQI